MTAAQAPDLQGAAEAICKQRGLEFRYLLGRGAFKSAYLAQMQGGQPVALKLAVVSGSPERLIRETAALRGCAHDGISQLLDAFPQAFGETLLWVVVEEFLPGGTLEEKLRGPRLDSTEVRHLALNLAGVLEHLHPRRLVHRDIKPANIIYRQNGTPVLTDFGIVRMLDQPSLTHAFLQQGPGTPAYAAPEQLTNEKALIDWRTDQFGLAIVLAECLLGHHPYLVAGASIHDAISAVAAKQEVPASSVTALKAAGFACLIQALKPWPIARYRRPAQFIDALKE